MTVVNAEASSYRRIIELKSGVWCWLKSRLLFWCHVNDKCQYSWNMPFKSFFLGCKNIFHLLAYCSKCGKPWTTSIETLPIVLEKEKCQRLSSNRFLHHFSLSPGWLSGIYSKSPCSVDQMAALTAEYVNNWQAILYRLGSDWNYWSLPTRLLLKIQNPRHNCPVDPGRVAVFIRQQVY